MRLTFAVTRWNPETDTHDHEEDYRLEVARGMTVLDALIRIKNEQDGTLSLRYSCRSAICGSCAMEINGSEKLACRTSIRKEWERHREITVAPLKNLAVIKDLAVDMRSFWQKNRTIVPWLLSREGARLSERRSCDPLQLKATGTPTSRFQNDQATTDRLLTPDPAAFHNVDACIQC